MLTNKMLGIQPLVHTLSKIQTTHEVRTIHFSLQSEAIYA